MNVYVDQSVRALAAARHRVDVFTADPGGIDGTGGTGQRLQISESITLHHLPVDARTKDELADAIDELARLLIDHPDFRAAEFVWAHYWISAAAGLGAHDIAWASVRPPLAVSIPTIGAPQNGAPETSHDRPQRLEAAERNAVEANPLQAATPAERRDLIRELRADQDSIVIARPGVDHCLYRPAAKSAARQRLGLPDDEAIVLYVGRMQFIKGTDVA